MDIDEIKVSCHNCVEDETGEPVYMIGDKTMYENTEAKTQNREFECELCGIKVTVNIKFY